ncbi:MAG: OprO/OprP family phosphate-selective porin [Chromatiales bacterium]|nr:OprO/OprP family phosphate-selective porin [Chromatiales bacterium]
MKLAPKRHLLALSATLLAFTTGQAAEAPTAEQMWEIIQQQQQQIEALQQQLNQTDEKVAETDQKVEIAGDMIEQAGGLPAEASWVTRSKIGGYGELHYNDLDSGNEMDFHRFVLFFGHQFTDNIRFFSEVELEHSIAGEGANGEVELEQAFIEFDLGDSHVAKAGLFLMPVGLINETHEPPTFYGVERNAVEKNIIPTTWWEAGGAVRGELAPGFSYDFAVTSGLNVPMTGGNAFKIRNGRQKVSEAAAESLAYTGRLKWTGMPGVELAMSAQYQEDITQGVMDVGATLFEAHADIQRGPFGLRALYARWDLDDAAAIAAADPAAAGRDEQTGWYIEPSVRGRLGDIPGEFGAFVRYDVWDNNSGAANLTEKRQSNLGFNYWPIPDVVLKFDIQRQDNEDGNDVDGFNLGVGYQF